MEGLGVSYGLNWALAGSGVIIKDITFHNLKFSELQQKGATTVTSHLSSISNVFVQDVAIGSSSKCDAKVRVISDSPSALLPLSNVLWKTPTRTVSHDTMQCSPTTGEIIGAWSQANTGFLAADIERSSLILCGKAFSDTNSIKDALAAVAGRVRLKSRDVSGN